MSMAEIPIRAVISRPSLHSDPIPPSCTVGSHQYPPKQIQLHSVSPLQQLLLLPPFHLQTHPGRAPSPSSTRSKLTRTRQLDFMVIRGIDRARQSGVGFSAKSAPLPAGPAITLNSRLQSFAPAKAPNLNKEFEAPFPSLRPHRFLFARSPPQTPREGLDRAAYASRASFHKPPPRVQVPRAVPLATRTRPVKSKKRS